MKLVKFGSHQTMLLASGAQVLFDHQEPLVVRTGGVKGLWYYRVDVTARVSAYIDEYLFKAAVARETCIGFAGESFLRVVEEL